MWTTEKLMSLMVFLEKIQLLLLGRINQIHMKSTYFSKRKSVQDPMRQLDEAEKVYFVLSIMSDNITDIVVST